MAYCDHCGERLEETERFCGACGTQVAPSSEADGATPGYKLEGVVGAGSSGTVYLAHDTTTGDRLAVKVLDPALASLDTARAHLAAEAATLARLRHPNVVAVYEYQEVPEPAVVMEYVEGTSLRQVLSNASALSPEQSLGVLSGALAGLGAAHAAGLVHGDIKPENILVDQTGTSKLADFGQTVARGSAGRGGTPSYMSPEAFRGQALDERSDIYSLGVVLFECLGGLPPFVAHNDAALALAHAESLPPRIDGLPEPVAALVDRALAKDPAGRPQSADQFTAELEAAASSTYGHNWATKASIAALVGGLGAAAIKEGVATAATGAPHGAGASATAHSAHQVPVAAKGLGAKLGATKVGVLLVSGAAVGGVAAAGGGGSTRPPPPPSQAPVPRLGLAVPEATSSGYEGLGEVRPANVHFGGDPTSAVSNIQWQSWGGQQATGTGISDWVAGGQTVAEGSRGPATIVAFDPGYCQGSGDYAYRKVKWYFPEHGETFNTGSYKTFDTCGGGVSLPPTTTTQPTSQLTINEPIYLRAGPQLGATQLAGPIQPGTTVTWLCLSNIGDPVGSSGDSTWSQISYNGQTGWIPQQNSANQRVYSATSPDPQNGTCS
jgi:serine/threonine-protein kinase